MNDLLSFFIIGISILTPGLSGGTTAVILGKYEKMVSLISNPIKNIKLNLTYLLKMIIGIIAGVYIGSFPISLILKTFPIFSKFFIAGISLASAISIVDKSIIRYFHYSIIGFALTLVLNHLPFNNKNIILTLIISLFIAIALILPGISITNILIAFNSYDLTVDAISNINVKYLLLNFGLVPLWVIFIAKIIEGAYKKYPKQTNGFVLGTIAASAVEALPSFSGNVNIASGIFIMLFGLFSFLFIFRHCKRTYDI